jgi:hypothetical protein
MMTRNKLVQVTTALLIGSFGLGGCSAIGDTLGSSKYPPDEFLVVAKTPLIIPPDYNLRPPGISDPLPREVDTSELAMRALFPDISTGSSNPSAAEDLLVEEAGGNVTGPGARSNLSPAESVAGKGSYTEDIISGEPLGGSNSSIESRQGIPEDPND